MVINTTANILSVIRQTLLVFIALTCITLNAAANAANITVTTSRNPVALDDSFHLVYEADSSVDDDPDFSPIYQDFDVLSSSQSTNMRSINGNWSLKKTWDLAVIAKNIGSFTIPPISFGKDTSPAIQVKVNNSTSPDSLTPKGQATVPATIFLENSLDKQSAWVQSQLIYTIRLLRTVGIANATLSEPVSSDPDAIIQKISEDSYQTTRKGIQYEVFERRYAIFPQKSGVLKIDPLTFEGRINATQPRTIFDQFRMSGQLKRLRSKAVEALVKANPASVNLQDWLPASNLQLIEEWSDDIQDLKAGEPVTRTITIAAEGLTGVQLPDLEFNDINGIKQYPDNSVVENRPGSNGITGLKQIKVALIPANAGTYTLPEIKLQWWNTKTDKKESASIPQQVLTAIGIASTSNIITTPKPTQTQPVQDGQDFIDNIKQSVLPLSAADSSYWKWLALAFALVWLVTLMLLLKKSKSNIVIDKAKTNSTATSVKSAVSAVNKHAKNNDSENTRVALIEWAITVYRDNTITNLSQIAGYCSPQLAEEIRHLTESLYSSEKPLWNGKNLITAFKNEASLIHKQPNKNASVLKPLYVKQH